MMIETFHIQIAFGLAVLALLGALVYHLAQAKKAPAAPVQPPAMPQAPVIHVIPQVQHPSGPPDPILAAAPVAAAAPKAPPALHEIAVSSLKQATDTMVAVKAMHDPNAPQHIQDAVVTLTKAAQHLAANAAQHSDDGARRVPSQG